MTEQNKEIYTLIPDIKEMVKEGVDVSQNLLDTFGENVKKALKEGLAKGCKKAGKHLRMSNIGTPQRKLWYIMNDYEGSEPSPEQLLSFTFGYIIEEYMLLLAQAAGHKVTNQQKEVELDGVVGHQDCEIDDVIIDVKGMSAYGFDKFESGRVLREDSFGYIPQISAYAQAQGKDLAGFLVFDKQRGRMTMLLLDGGDMVDAKKKIKAAREAMLKDTPPERCYKPIAAGTSGNEILSKNCMWCPFHKTCWADANEGKGLRHFKYADGIKSFVKIVKKPRAVEIIDETKDDKVSEGIDETLLLEQE